MAGLSSLSTTLRRGSACTPRKARHNGAHGTCVLCAPAGLQGGGLACRLCCVGTPAEALKGGAPKGGVRPGTTGGGMAGSGWGPGKGPGGPCGVWVEGWKAGGSCRG